MDTKDLKGLMEAYSEVYAPQQIDEISQKTATSAYASSKTGEFEGADSDRDVKRTDNLKKHIVRKFGKEAGEHADKAAESQTFGRKDASGRRKQTAKPRIEKSDYRTTKDGKMHKQDQRELKTELRIKRDRRLRAARGEDTNEQFDIFVDEGYQRDPEGAERKKTYSKQPDPSKSGFTGIGNMSIDQIRKMSARIEKENTKKEEVDIFDTVLEYLVAEGYADNNQEALKIMANLSEEEILEYKKLAAGLVGGMMALNMMKPGIPSPQHRTPTPERERTELPSSQRSPGSTESLKKRLEDAKKKNDADAAKLDQTIQRDKAQRDASYRR